MTRANSSEIQNETGRPPRRGRAGLAAGLVAACLGGLAAGLVAACLAGSARADETSAFWRFDEGTSDKALDASGRKNHGVITGATYTDDVPALPGRSENRTALLFDAVGDYVEIKAGKKTNLYQFPDGFTFEAYLRPAALPIPPDGFGQRLEYVFWANDDVIALVLVSDAAGQTTLRGGVNNVRGAPGPCSVNVIVPFDNATTFSHVAMTYGDELLTLYVDGVEVGSRRAPAGCGSAVGPVDEVAVMRIGADETATCCPGRDRFFRGVIDQVRISGGALPVDDLLDVEAIEGCPEEPLATCARPAKGGASKLVLDSELDAFKWVLKQTRVKLRTLGNPLLDTDYYACLYDAVEGVPALVAEDALPAGRLWRFKKASKSLVFSNPAAGGISKIKVKSGGKKKAVIKLIGAGSMLPELPLAQDPQVLLQLISSDGVCWEAPYDAPAIVNDGVVFSDRSE